MAQELSMDETFMNLLADILEANLENEHFGVKELAKEMGVSRSQLHRKLNVLRGKSSSQYIREYRLQKAMEMLQGEIATASEIAYRVGFGSPTYFNTSFKEFYGFTPGEVKFRTAKSELTIQAIPRNDSGFPPFPTKFLIFPAPYFSYPPQFNIIYRVAIMF